MSKTKKSIHVLIERLEKGAGLTFLKWSLALTNVVGVVLIALMLLIIVYTYGKITYDLPKAGTDVNLIVPLLLITFICIMMIGTALIGFLGSTLESSILLYYHSCLTLALLGTTVGSVGITIVFKDSYLRHSTDCIHTFIRLLWQHDDTELTLLEMGIRTGLTEFMKDAKCCGFSSYRGNTAPSVYLEKNKTLKLWTEGSGHSSITKGKPILPVFCCPGNSCGDKKSVNHKFFYLDTENTKPNPPTFYYRSCYCISYVIL